MHPYIVFALLFQKFGFEHRVLNVSYQNTLNCNVTAVVQQILPAYSSDKLYCLFTVILMIFKVFSQKDTNKVRSLGVWLALRVRDRNFSNLVLKSNVQESFKGKQMMTAVRQICTLCWKYCLDHSNLPLVNKAANIIVKSFSFTVTAVNVVANYS